MQRAVEYLQSSRRLTVLLISLSLILVVLSALFGIIVNLLVFVAIIAIGSYYVIDKQPVYGLVILIASSFFLPLAIKIFHLYDLPVTTFIELLNLILLIALLIKGRLSGIKTLPGILVAIWCFLQFVEIFNPNAHSRIAGVLAFRSTIMVVIAFYTSYSSIRTKQDVYAFYKGWFFLAGLAAVYGFYQEFVSLPSYDYQWATAGEFRYKLLFTWGRLRKFSFFTSPGEFGFVMVYGGMACLIMSFFTQLSSAKRIVLFIAAALMFWAMMFTGSRTAMILLTAGIFIFAALTLWRNVLIAVFVVVALGTVVALRPTSSKTMHVMMTAFEGTEDNSMKVRVINQKIIRGYIKGAPLGFGIGSTGYYGAKYSGGTFIGSFPPDSELVKIAIETGWIGLFIWCSILALLFGWGINVYFNLRDKEVRNLMIIPLVELFIMIVAQYPQEMFRAPVLAISFAYMIGLMTKLRVLDRPTMYTHII